MYIYGERKPPATNLVSMRRVRITRWNYCPRPFTVRGDLHPAFVCK